MVGGEKTSLGGEYVGGEIVPWWRVSLVASLPGGEVTGNRKNYSKLSFHFPVIVRITFEIWESNYP